MEMTEDLSAASARQAWTDEEVVERVKAGETASYEIIMRRYNRRSFGLRALFCGTMPRRKM
jgi:hypothetical protein